MTDRDYPPKLAETVELLELLPERGDRIEFLIDVADRFREVAPEIASRPFPEPHRVPACESEAFVWATERDDGGLDFHFAVENPQGISAMAMAVLLAEGLSGEDPERVAGLSGNLVYDVFGRELSMGKSMGLMGMVGMVANAAKRHLAGEEPIPSTAPPA